MSQARHHVLDLRGGLLQGHDSLVFTPSCLRQQVHLTGQAFDHSRSSVAPPVVTMARYGRHAAREREAHLEAGLGRARSADKSSRLTNLPRYHLRGVFPSMDA